jgi:hypothetical protein
MSMLLFAGYMSGDTNGEPWMSSNDSMGKSTRYMSSERNQSKEICKPHEYSGVCWNERPMGSHRPRTNAHPAVGELGTLRQGTPFERTWVTFMICGALHESLVMEEADGQVLPDPAWPVVEYYETKRQKIRDQRRHHWLWRVQRDLGILCNLPVIMSVSFRLPRTECWFKWANTLTAI